MPAAVFLCVLWVGSGLFFVVFVGFCGCVMWFMVFWFDVGVVGWVDYLLVAGAVGVLVMCFLPGVADGWFCWLLVVLGCGGVVCELDSVFCLIVLFMPVYFCF